MKLDALFKSVVVSLCVWAGMGAVVYAIYGILFLFFWRIEVVTTVFCIGWASVTYRVYHLDNPEWLDRARILIRASEEEES